MRVRKWQNEPLNDDARSLIALVSCGLLGGGWQKAVGEVDWFQVHKLAACNSLEGVSWCGVEVAGGAGALGIETDLAERWAAEADATMWRRIQFDVEREAVCETLAERGIATLPLKGATLAAYFPDPRMRFMADNDILFGFVESDCCGGARERGRGFARGGSMRRATLAAREAMEGLGYACKGLFGWNNDGYRKPPLFYFELHRGPVPPNSPLAAYYSEPWSRAKKASEDSLLSYRFAPEDEYLYVLAHAWNHFATNGCGFRFTVDVIVLLRTFGETMDWDYVSRELVRMGQSLARFECQMRLTALWALGTEEEHARFGDTLMEASGSLAGNSFDPETFSAFLLGCGTFGSESVRLARAAGELEAGGYDPDASRGKLAYVWHRLSMAPDGRRFAYPLLGSTQILFPAFVFARLGSAIKHAPRVLREIAAVNQR